MRLSKDRVAAVVDTGFGREMLDASDRAQAGNPESEQVWLLLVSEIEPDPEQPRRHFDTAALQELADDIERRGVLQPIIVRRTNDPLRESKPYRIIVGERRWRASSLAGKPRIPCLVRDLDGSEAREAQLVENVIRKDISDVERGVALRRLYDEMKAADRGVTWDRVAQRVGLSRMRIHHLYSLSMLPEPIITLIQSGRLSGSHGTEIARLSDQGDEVQIALAQEAARPEGLRSGAYHLSVAQVRERVNQLLGAADPEAQDNNATSGKKSPVSRIERHLSGVSAALRPDMSEDVRERLRRHAEDILRFLDGGRGDGDGGDSIREAEPDTVRERADGPETEPSVKLTLQTTGR